MRGRKGSSLQELGLRPSPKGWAAGTARCLHTARVGRRSIRCLGFLLGIEPLSMAPSPPVLAFSICTRRPSRAPSPHPRWIRHLPGHLRPHRSFWMVTTTSDISDSMSQGSGKASRAQLPEKAFRKMSGAWAPRPGMLRCFWEGILEERQGKHERGSPWGLWAPGTAAVQRGREPLARPAGRPGQQPARDSVPSAADSLAPGPPPSAPGLTSSGQSRGARGAVWMVLVNTLACARPGRACGQREGEELAAPTAGQEDGRADRRAGRPAQPSQGPEWSSCSRRHGDGD